MRTLPSLVLAVLVLAPRVVAAQSDDVVGTFNVSGSVRGRPFAARIAIGRSGGGLRLTTEKGQADLGDGTAPATEGPWTFALGPTVAAVGSAARRLEVQRLTTGDLGAVLRENANVVGSFRLVRARRSLVIPSALGSDSDCAAFRRYALEASRYFWSRGSIQNDLLTGVSWASVIATLERASASGHVYDRVVIVGHGGWDGPILSGPEVQATPRETSGTFAALARAIARGTSRDAIVVASACHSGGSNVFELADGITEYQGDVVFRWADALAALSNRTVVGPAGITSTEYTERLVLAVEHEGDTVQETRVARRSGARTFGAGERIAP